jgi:hypothetical protein
MSRRVPLRQLAHARAGDKGDRSNVSVWCYDPRHYPALAAQLTAERIRQAFPGLLKGPAQRFEMAHLAGLNFIMDRVLEGGVKESLNLDSHGKSWRFLILALDVELEDA